MSAPITVPRRVLVGAAIALAVVPALVAGGTAFAVSRSFSDVPPTHPFYDQITWAEANGIVNGFADGTFRPGNTVTRQAATAFVSGYNDSIEIVEHTEDPPLGSSWWASAECPAGKRAISGGGSISVDHTWISDSFPDGSQWSVRWEIGDIAPPDPAELKVWAICAPEPAG